MAVAQKPLIGLNADFRGTRKEGPAVSFLQAGYYTAIERSGGIPVIVPPLADEDDLGRVLEGLNGFVMVGGGDLDPRRDGFQLHTSIRPMDTRREDFDRTLMRLIGGREIHPVNVRVGGFYRAPTRA